MALPWAKIDKEQIIANLREVYDPEISTNVYDLGLIYDISIDEKESSIITQYMYKRQIELVKGLKT